MAGVVGWPDEFKAGESVVLTLADQQVVQTEANGTRSTTATRCSRT